MDNPILSSTIKIQFRQGLAASWTLVNPVLKSGEPGFEIDTGKEKRGDGVSVWNDLPYISDGDHSMTMAASISTRDTNGQQSWARNHLSGSLTSVSGVLTRNPDGTLDWHNGPNYGSGIVSYNGGDLNSDTTPTSPGYDGGDLASATTPTTSGYDGGSL